MPNIKPFVGVPPKPKPLPVETPCENDESRTERQVPPRHEGEYVPRVGPMARGARPQPQAVELPHEDDTDETVQTSDREAIGEPEPGATHTEDDTAPTQAAASEQARRGTLRHPVDVGRVVSGNPHLMEEMRFPYTGMPSFAVKYIQAVALECQISADFVAMQVLGATGAVTMGRFAVQVRPNDPNWREHVTVFLLSALASGSAKTPVTDRAWAPLTAHEKVLMRLALIRKGSAKVELKVVEEKLEELEAVPAARRTEEQADAIVDLHGQACNLRREVACRGERCAHDYTQEALADFLWREGTVVINPDEVDLPTLLGTRWRGKENFKLYLSAYSGKDDRIVRKTTGTTAIETPLCTICISTQRKPLEEMMENEQVRERGLFARFMINVPPDKRAGKNPLTQIPVPEDVAREYERFMEYILSYPENRHDPILMKMSREAFECFSEHVAECAVLGSSETHATMADWLAKMGSHLSRIAGILHVMLAFQENFAPDEQPISEDTVCLAIEIMRYFERQMYSVLNSTGSGTAKQSERRILDVVTELAEESDRVTSSAIWQRVKGRKLDFPNAQTMHDALDGLVHRGLLIELPKVSNGNGRPARAFILGSENEG